jgi:hypothetical protein
MSSARLNSAERLRGDAKDLGLVYTQAPFELDFDVWSETNTCFAADIREGRGRTIWGVLYEIPDYLIERRTATARHRRALDAIEGSLYQRRPIAVRWRNGKPVKSEVISYTVVNPGETQATSLDYARYILTGLREHNAPNGYMAYVKSRIVVSNPALAADIERL